MKRLPKTGRRHLKLHHFTADLQFNEFHRITQEELNDLIGDLDLVKIRLNC